MLDWKKSREATMKTVIARQFCPGDVVRVCDDDTGAVSEPVAVSAVYATSGGLRLERAVFGFISWNERDCIPA
jgi:hypothetical protein